VAQLAAVLAGYVTAAVVFARCSPRPARTSAAAGLALLAGISVIAVTAH
jgi:hypothetical protein